MPRKQKTYHFYTWTMTCANGRCCNTFEHAGSTVHRWPNAAFENLAQRLGYDRLVRDESLVGGYFANSDGDCLVCVPHGFEPEAMYL